MTAQILLALFSLTAVFLFTSGHPFGQKWGPVAGLCSQPFWLWATFSAGQAGMFLLACVYTALYLRAIYREFYIKRNRS